MVGDMYCCTKLVIIQMHYITKIIIGHVYYVAMSIIGHMYNVAICHILFCQWAGDCAPPSHFTPLLDMVWCCHVVGLALLTTTFCAYRFFFYSLTTSDGSGGTTAGHVVSPRSIMVLQGFRSKEARRARKQNIDYAKQHHTPHCWLPAMVLYPAMSTKRFSWLTHSTPIFIVEERSCMSLNVFCHL